MMLRLDKWPRKLTATLFVVVAVGLALGLYVALADLLVPPDKNVAGFEVDGDLCVGTLPLADRGKDWATLPATTGCPNDPAKAVFLPGGDKTCRGVAYHKNLEPSVLICDDTSQSGSIDSNILSPTGKDWDPTTWCTQAGNNPVKVDLANVMAYSAGGKIYAAMDRLSNNGAALARFEINRNAFAPYVPGNCPNAANTVPDRVGDGCAGPLADDLEIIYYYTGGGRNVNITINHWKTTGTSAADANGNTVPLGMFEFCGETVDGRVNDGTDRPSTGNIIVPPYLPTITCSTSQTGGNSCRLIPSVGDDRIGPRTFMEGAIEVPGATCGGWIHAESITSSGAENPDLKDIAGPEPFALCGLEVTKTPNHTDVCTQDADIEYTYAVHNTGVVDLTVTVVDDYGTPANPLDDIDLTPLFKAANGDSDVLAAGATVTFKNTTTLTATTTNTVTATGSYGGATVKATAKATVKVHTCDIEIDKTVSPEQVCEGSNTPVTYTFHVWNPGDVNLTNVTLTDTVLDDATVQAAFEAANGDSDTLSTAHNSYANAVVFTVGSSISATTTNTVTVTGDALGLSPADSDSDDATVTAYTCDIAVTKDCVDAAAGEPITFSGTVTNTGDVLLVDVTVTDDNATPGNPSDDVVVLGPISLAPGASAGYSGSYTPTMSPSTNTVKAEGTPWLLGVLGDKVTATDDATCEVFGCALSPGFWGGGEGVQKWDDLTSIAETSDPIAWAAGFATFTPFPYAAAGLTDPTPADGVITYLDIIRITSKGGDPTIQLGFKYVAAKLNQAAFGVPPSTADLLLEIEDFFDAVPGDNADANTTDLYTQPVGSNPSGAAKTEARRLKGLLDAYFSSVGEAFCPATGDIPEL